MCVCVCVFIESENTMNKKKMGDFSRKNMNYQRFTKMNSHNNEIIKYRK